MSRNKILTSLIISILSLGLIVGCGESKSKAETESKAATATEKNAKDFTLTLLDGKKLTLNDLKGKAVMINVWDTWCPPCKAEIPDFIELYNEYKDKGLVILSGCAHSGIVNTIEHAKEFTGVDKIYGVIGGFHLARASDEEIEKTIEYIKKDKPKYVVPTHCSGFRAIRMFAEEMPEEFIEGIVGITYIL